MLVNTKHIVLFDDAAEDLGRIANMVDNDGAVLMLKDGRPAYVMVAFEDVEEADRAFPAAGKGEGKRGGCCKDKAPEPPAEPSGQCQHPGEGPHKCTCGRNPGGMCGGHGPEGHEHSGHEHGGHGHDHGHGGHGHGHPHGHGRDHGGFAGAFGGDASGGFDAEGGGMFGGSWQDLPGILAGRFPGAFPGGFPGGFPTGPWATEPPTSNEPENDKGYRGATTGETKPPTPPFGFPGASGFEHGQPGFLPPELNNLIPDDVMQAGQSLVNRLVNLFGTPADDSENGESGE